MRKDLSRSIIVVYSACIQTIALLCPIWLKSSLVAVALLTCLPAREGPLMPPGKRRGKRSQASEDARWARYLAAKERAKQEGTPFVPHSRDPTQPKQKAKAKPSA